MKSLIIEIAVLLFISVALTELHMIVFFFYPQTATETHSIWIDKNYNENITLLWYIYDLCSILKNIVWSYAFAKLARLVSFRLFKVLVVFFFYFLTQFAFYVWNRNTVFFSNIIVYFYMALAIVFFFIPNKKGGKLINIEDY
jgi:hypothetical protein